MSKFRLIVGVMICCSTLSVVFSLPAAAKMPSPYEAEWSDHTKQFWVGADAADQIFASGTVAPTGGGHFHYHLKCEHNDPGDAVAIYQLEFLSHGKTVESHTKICSTGGAGSISIGPIQGKYGGARPEFDWDLNLSKVIDQVDRIRFTAHNGPDFVKGMSCDDRGVCRKPPF